MAEMCGPDRRDLISGTSTQVLLWRLPAAAIVASSLLKDSPLKAGIWTAAFGQTGIACLLNASRCGRLHCYFTGPLFLLGGGASLLRGLRVVRVAWNRIG